MKMSYKGFEISVSNHCQPSAGWLKTRYSMVRKIDEWVVTDGFTHEPVETVLENLKKLANELTEVVDEIIEGRPGARKVRWRRKE